MSRKQIASPQAPAKSEGWHALMRLQPQRLSLGPHSQQIFDELIIAARGEHQPLSVVLLAATLADVALYEGMSYRHDDTRTGLDWLSAGERRHLDWLRARRNALVHHDGPVDGLMGQAGDAVLLSADADRALGIVAALLEGLESF